MPNDRVMQNSWAPDERTIDWVSGIMHESRIAATLRREFEERRGDLDPESDDYWLLLAGIAVEHVTHDLWEQVRRWSRRSDAPEDPTES